MATMEIPGMGYGLRYEYGIFKQTIKDGGNAAAGQLVAASGSREVARLDEAVEVKLNCSFELGAHMLRPVVGRPSVLLGIPLTGRSSGTAARPSIPCASGLPARRITSISSCLVEGILWGHWQKRSQRSHLRVCSTPMIRHPWGRPAFLQSISWWPARWLILCGAFVAASPIGMRC